MALSKHHHRQQPSDPFSDPAVSYSSYGVPTLAKNPSSNHNSQPLRPPPLPPKRPTKLSAAPMPNGDSVADAIKEVVTVRRVEQPPRTRVGRSQTHLPPASSSRPVQPPRRSISQDSSPPNSNPSPADKEKGKARRPPNKKGSSHADIIDRMDFSGVGPMFHHDGPFDACAPSRNRHRIKAPMYAWSGAPKEDQEAFAAAREIPAGTYSSPYPSPGLYAPYEPSKKKHDAIAEAWGVHEPEPYEDFSAGGGIHPRASGEYVSPFPTRPSTAPGGNSRRTKEPKEKHREYLGEAPPPSRRQPIKRPNLPPPQPIFVPEGDADTVSPPSPTATASGAPKRTKSLLQRIRKMRDAPNIPVSYDEAQNTSDQESSPTSSTENATKANSRPTHRSQNSFLGRLGRNPNSAPGTSPTSEPEQFVYVDDPSRTVPRKDKSLPATPLAKPSTEGTDGYFDPTSGGAVGSPGGLGRRASLLRKMKDVVKGTASK